MSFTNAETEALLADSSKKIEGDIAWSEDEDRSPAVEFRVEVRSDSGYPLFLRGRINPLAKTLSFSLIHRQFGRIYGLDLGMQHHNPDCAFIGEKHKHKYEEGYSDKRAYVPSDVTADIDDLIGIWRQFCDEAGILHEGALQRPPAAQAEFFL